MTLSTWDPEEFIACARYGEMDQMIQLICVATNTDQFSDIPYEVIASFIKSRNTSNQTALHLSAANGHLVVVEFLLKYLNPKEINATTDQGSTALHWASLNGHLPVVQKIIEFGGDATLKNALGRSSVTLAEQQSHLEVVQELLKSYDPEEEDDECIDENMDNMDNLDGNGDPLDLEKNE